MLALKYYRTPVLEDCPSQNWKLFQTTAELTS